VWQQSRKSGVPKTLLNLVKRHPRETKAGGCLSGRLPFAKDPAQHFVLHLHQIAGVEEELTLKQRILHPLGMGVEAAIFG
jgi:hypothetical protein